MVSSADIARKYGIPLDSIPKLITAMSTNSGQLTGSAVKNHTQKKIGPTKLPELSHELRLLDANQLSNLHAEQPSSTGQASEIRVPIKITNITELQTAIKEKLIKEGDAVEIQSLITPKGRDIYPVWEVKSSSTGTVGLIGTPNGTTNTLILLINHIQPKPRELDTPNMAVKTHSRNINLKIIPKQG